MRKRIFGRRLKRDKNARTALFKGLMRSLIMHGRIHTTEAKAKAIKGKVEKLVTKAKKRGASALPEFLKYFKEDISNRLINDIAPKFLERPGGYTRIIRAVNRKKDNASMVLLEWVELIEAMPIGSINRSQSTPVVKKDKKVTIKKEVSKPAKEIAPSVKVRAEKKGVGRNATRNQTNKGK